MLIYAFVGSSEGAIDKSKFDNYVSETNLNEESISGKEASSEKVANKIVVDKENEEIGEIKIVELVLNNQKVSYNKAVSKIENKIVISKNNEIILVSPNLNKPIFDLDASVVEVATNLAVAQSVDKSSQVNIFNEKRS